MPVIDDLQGLITTARDRVAEAFAPPPVRHDDIAVSWHPMVLAASAPRAMAEHLLDAIYAAHPALLQHKHITVACPALADGLGDLALAWRVCSALRRHAPSAHLSLVVPQARAAEALGDAHANVQVVAVAQAFDVVLLCDLLLVAPDPSAARYSSEAMHAWVDEAATRYPTLAVTEYGSGAPQSLRWHTLATGLGPLADGIMIDPELASAARAHLVAPPATRNAVMRAWVAESLPMASHKAWGALHVLYVREPEALQPAIARALGAYAGDLRELLLLVLRHAPTEVDVAAWQHAGLPVTQHPTPPAAHLASVVSLAALPPAQFRAALLHADFAAVTGDQSLGEAIAAQVPFVYEARTHKQTLAHRLQETASRFGAEAHRAMAPLGAQLPPPLVPRDAWQAMCRHLCEVSDVTPRLLGRAARTLHATAESRAEEVSVTEACAQAPSPAGDALLQQQLQCLQARVAAHALADGDAAWRRRG